MSNLYTIAIALLLAVLCVNSEPLNLAYRAAVQLESGVTIISSSSQGKKGLTFVKEAHLVDFGIDLVGCRNWSDPNGMDCNAYSGDTLCTERRPVLCTKVDNSPRPAYIILGQGAAMPASFYAGWNRGHIATTVPVQGSQFANRAAVDAYCAQSFGTGWNVAQFHDGMFISGMNGTTYSGASWTNNAKNQQSGGWHYYSYGDVRNDIRFWVHIRDQPSTCWAQ
ncbi:unnamed protein product [Adineta ricciae]|uniref:Uncharacterized protein n=1 Tax=Adineta ricciae TaxID=249248 RepID=A0A813XND6_ADIRI|nr:unnamed protein product [Adineta ricciae]CAF1376099.1 unnamed protein product [Adineta ricciae]